MLEPLTHRIYEPVILRSVEQDLVAYYQSRTYDPLALKLLDESLTAYLKDKGPA